jgi:hypothetical protein
MPLSRLDNFLKNTRGNILYVNPNDLDSTDSIENQGNSLTRPFKTIQRALIEASRFSYQRGLDNDRFGQTTILVYPGDHLIDNRPGWIPDGASSFRLRNGTTSNDFSQFDLTTNFDLTTDNNALYKLNSVYGGIIIPRGTSLVGLDLRKTKIRPKYIPNPENDNIERSAIFRVTGACYFWQYSILDGDPSSVVYKDYTNNTFVPNFSHHKLTCFEYADGRNAVDIDDAFLTYSTTRTDLDMYYEKVGLVYGPSSGREIEPDYPSSSIDIQPKIDEYRIVGPTGGEIEITSILSGDGSTSSTEITVTTAEPFVQLAVDTAIQINGVTATGYNGQYVVTDVISPTQFKYQVSSAPSNPSPTVTGATVNLSVDTVSSASPYIFNVSLRSVYGMCGLHADGNKADGFKSMVVAQFTGIGLQKDDNAFVKYDPISGIYKDSTYAGNDNIHTDSLAVYKPTYENYHIKCSNNSFLQIVSVFAIGFAQHFVGESGGDQSITNSNSNFGAKSLIASGFRREAFSRDDVGYITHIIPPKELTTPTTNIEFDAIDVATTVGVASTNRLYLYNRTNEDIFPDNVIEGYRIGAKENDTIKCLISQGGTPVEYSARIILPNTQFTLNEVTSEKKFVVGRSAGINSITSNIITLTGPHNFIEGESIRFLSDTGQLPDGLENNRIYYAITSGISTSQVKVAKTLNDALNAQELTINNKGGTISVVSRVSDKNSGDIGHPIQYDSSQGQWYINVSTASTDNNLYSTITSLGTNVLGSATPRTYITRQPDTRNLADTIYKLRYVIPAGSGITSARPPIDGFVIQESNDTTGSTNAEVQTYFSPTTVSLSNVSEQRNFRFISNANWDGTFAHYQTELPHNLSVGSVVEVLNITSTNNTTGIASAGFNNTFSVVGISSAKSFYVELGENPGTFTNDLSNRTTDLPRFNRKRFNDTYYVYRSQEIQKYVPGEQDGVYHLVVLNASNKPTVAPFSGQNFSQPVQNLYPQTNRDNPASDPQESVSYAVASPVGQVVIDDPKHSITKETINKTLDDINVGFGVTNIISNIAGAAHTIYTNIDHGLNRITAVSIASSGSGYGSGTATDLYNANLVGFAGSTTGNHATARISVDGIGGIINVEIMDGGSAYGIGNTLAVVGIATTAGFVQGYVTVTDIYDNSGDVIRVSGVSSDSQKDYNQLYRITSVPVGSTKEINVASASVVGNANTTGVGVTLTSDAFGYLTGEALNVTSLVYDSVSGLATVTTSQRHGLRVDNKIRIAGANDNFYNKDFIVTRNTDLNNFVINVGVATISPSTSGTIYVYRNGVTSNEGNVTIENENIGGRQIVEYAGITTTLSAVISSATTTDIEIQDISTLDINIGDYLLIDDEIVRVKTTVTANPISVFRGVLGTRATTHVINSVVRRIRVNPVEFRRNSILRASGHTFEYLGYGPGNYSTALPERQDRQLSSSEEFLAQSIKYDGGIVVYTGMNSDGDFYIGNKKVSSATGQEEVFDAPIPTVTGEDIAPSGVSVGFDVLSPLEVSISRSLRVEGGPNNNIISEFDGPVILNNKLTSTSNKGMEAASIFLQGDATVSRKFTVGISTPSLSGNPGDVVYNARPDKGGYLGWVYTNQNDWYRFGNVSISQNSNVAIFDQVGVGTTSVGNFTLKVGSGSSEFSVDNSGGVGIGTSANQFKLNVIGDTNLVGDVYGSTFYGDGSGLVNVSVPASGWTPISGGLYNTSLNLVGIGTSVPRYTLEVGSVSDGGTSLWVNNTGRFENTLSANNVIITGIITSSSYNLTGGTGTINAGIVTSSSLFVGTGGTVVTANSTSVGIGTAIPRSKLDVEGNLRIKTSREAVETLTITSNVVTIDLSKAQNFTLTASDDVNQFTITNPPGEASSFSIIITQDSTGGRVIDIDDFRTSGGSLIPVYWPGGGVLPIVTPTASRSDIYTFKTFDGGSTWYGVVVGQNFNN